MENIKVMPVFKSGSKDDVKNYRPISILSVIPKIIDQHVYNHFYDFLCEHKLLSIHQSGFWKKYSCNTCLVKIKDDWLKSMNDGKIVGCLAADLSKALDLINFEILVEKLKIYGCSDIMIKWFKSYLYGRTQIVMLNKIM